VVVYEYARTGDLATLRHLPLDVLGVRNHAGSTPVQVACAYGHPDIVSYFIHSGVDATTVDNEGWTVLHSCVAEIPTDGGEDRDRFMRVLDLILTMTDVDVLARTNDDESALDLVPCGDDGMPDDAVSRILSVALQRRGVDSMEVDSDDDFGDGLKREKFFDADDQLPTPTSPSTIQQ
jgi:hypothetical protein